MALVKQRFDADVFQYRSTGFAQYVKVDGTNAPVPGVAFDSTTEESAFIRTQATNYGTGNWTFTLDWYGSATTGGVTWGISVSAITANTDTGDVETKAFATETTVNDTHLGTTAKRAHTVSVTVSNLDSVALDDWVNVRVSRKTGDAGDTMSGDAILTMMNIAYSDS